MTRILELIALAALAVAPAMSGAAQEPTEPGQGGELRVLDKLTGVVTDLQLAPGEARKVGRVDIAMRECRFPAGNPAGDAFAYLTVQEIDVANPVYQGWMIASAPALNAMDHPRYDVWVLRCTTA